MHSTINERGKKRELEERLRLKLKSISINSEHQNIILVKIVSRGTVGLMLKKDRNFVQYYLAIIVANIHNFSHYLLFQNSYDNVKLKQMYARMY